MRRTAAGLFTVLALAHAGPVAAQKPETKLEPTTTVDAARTGFRSALYESQNVSPERARKHMAAATAADPQFGLGKVYQSVVANGITAAQRESQIAASLGAMGSASPAEVLLALYWRENAAGRGPAALPILKAAAELVPGDAEIAYVYDNALRVGKQPKEQAVTLRRFVERFPDHAASHNQLAYTLWAAGDPAGSLAAVERYEKLAPDHPNSHDSHADILLLMGRGREALPHVQRELELDPSFVGAHAKMGAIELTLGNTPAARKHFATAVSSATVPADRIEAFYWQSAAHVYDRNGKAAIRETQNAATAAKEGAMPGAQALAHDRSAVLEAYMGNRKAVAGHLATAKGIASNPAQRATYHAHAAIALSRLGQADQARAAFTEFTAAAAADDERTPQLEALLALDRKDYATAESKLAGITDDNQLVRALRAELMMRTGRKQEGAALRQQVLAGSVKLDGNAPIDFNSLIARMRVGAL